LTNTPNGCIREKQIEKSVVSISETTAADGKCAVVIDHLAYKNEKGGLLWDTLTMK